MPDLTIRAIVEDEPGPKWQASFAQAWPAYRAWYLRSGIAERPGFTDCRRALKEHMPEWVPTWERLSELAGGGDIEARFLSMWCPPFYIGACSQAVWPGPGAKLLVRNYDYSPNLLEGSWFATRWAGRRVVAMSDCLCGALDGINESGLAVSLAFGGSKAHGEGFGIPLVLRYVLETCATTREAVAILSRVPVHMAYNVTLLDRGGDAATVFVGPSRRAEALPVQPVTNHQRTVEWAHYAATTRSVQRLACLEAELSGAGTADDLIAAMLRPPLRQTSYAQGLGTLYTAVYDPAALGVSLVWPTRRWDQTVQGFQEDTVTVPLGDDGMGGPS